MKFNTKNIELKQNGFDRFFAIIEYPRNLHDKLKELTEKDCIKSIEIKQKRNKRSLDANAALWVMLDKMAQKLRTTKDELYLDMLDKYGVFTHIVIKKEAVYRVKEEWRTVREIGEVTVNGKTGIQLQCFFGSSQYDTKEFSRLLEGVIEEAKEIGVEFISKEDMTLILEEWGK